MYDNFMYTREIHLVLGVDVTPWVWRQRNLNTRLFHVGNYFYCAAFACCFFVIIDTVQYYFDDINNRYDLECTHGFSRKRER